MKKEINNSVILPLEGVESEHCSLVVARKMEKIPGVTQSKVELNNQRAIVRADSQETVQKVIKEIRDLGYGISTVKENFPVLNMACASCAAGVENILNDQPGVISAAVNYPAASVQIEYLPNMINDQALQQAVRSGGYDLLPASKTKKNNTVEEINLANYLKLRTKVIWALVLATPLFVVGMFFMEMPYANLIMWALATPIVVWLGKDFFVNAWKQARHRSANMDTLVALSVGVAYIFSVFNTIYPSFWESQGLSSHVYFEAAGIVIAFILLGKLLEAKAKGNTSSAIKKLMSLQPETVTLILSEGEQKIVPLEEVKIGDIVMVKPGEKVALDGLIVSGKSYVDESMLTGESMPIPKEIQDQVFAGTLNDRGSFQFKVSKVGEDTLLAHIIQMVQNAQGSKAPVQRLVDKIAGVFVSVVIGVSIITLLCWILLGGANGFSHGLLAMITVLVIACPCALGLATPTAIMVGIGKGAQNGILIKDASSLEQAGKLDVILLDKTGTITEGKPAVTDSLWIQDSEWNRDVLYNLESHSEHPLAGAVMAYLNNKNSILSESFESVTGRGVQAIFNGETFYAGNKKMMDEKGVSFSELVQSKVEQWRSEGKSLVYFAGNKSLIAVLAITDSIKENSVSAIDKLHKMGLEVFMLTGDNHSAASKVASIAGIDHFESEMLPEQKLAFVEKLQNEGKKVAMVGDGINDSAALAKANVGIAMGAGSDIAMEVAGITIISSELDRLPIAIQLSKKTTAAIRQNLFWAFIYNVIGIPIAAGILYPINGFLLNPMIAGAAMAMSSVSVVANSLRLKKVKLY